MQDMIFRFIRDDRGATAIEYGMLVALFSLAILVAARTTGSSIINTFNTARDTMFNAT
jgi:pilus assembly protein Flp/PilA